MALRVLITGAAGGIGRALAARFTASGYHVIGTARQTTDLADVTCHERLELDVTDAQSVARAIARTGRVDVLVNNAGVGAGGPTEHVPVEAARRVIEVNFFGAAHMIHAVLPQMRERGNGVIIAISSMSARLPWPFGSYYAASKAAMERLHEAVAVALGATVRVIIAEPGLVDTAFGDRFASYGADDVNYAPTSGPWARQFAGSHLSPDTVADRVVNCVQSSSEQLMHVPIGEDAEEALRTRDTLSTREFVSWLAARHGLPAGPGTGDSHTRQGQA